MTAKKSDPPLPQPVYEPTAAELPILRKFFNQPVPPPRAKVVYNNGVPGVVPDHPDQVVGYALLGEALGSANLGFIYGLLRQLANASSKGGKIDVTELNFMLAIVIGIKPQDEVEAMIAVQMAAIQSATMTFARRLANVETLPQQDSAERALNKLTRTFVMQVEALKRYRTGGEQKVTVQHVSVSQGGQAIVGNVTQGPRASAAPSDAQNRETTAAQTTAGVDQSISLQQVSVNEGGQAIVGNAAGAAASWAATDAPDRPALTHAPTPEIIDEPPRAGRRRRRKNSTA